ncbi:MAG: class I SAM-dependent methyltransferase [Spirochaetes bacterium]|nr:class I SAM-dependent methyltransferase [Spirochaetota bacterium]
MLVVGGGTGKILVEMLRQNIGQSYVYVDISKSMIRATKRRVRRYFKTEKADGARPRIQYVCADIGRMPLAKYDLVITPFVLDCFGDAALSLLIPKLAQALSRRGSWIFTDFHIAEGRPQPLARLLIRFLYFCFNRFCGLQRSQLPDFPFFFRNERRIFFSARSRGNAGLSTGGSSLNPGCTGYASQREKKPAKLTVMRPLGDAVRIVLFG